MHVPLLYLTEFKQLHYSQLETRGLCYLHKQISFSAVSNAVRYFHSNSQCANLSANKSTHTVGITKQGGALVSGPNNCFIEIFDKQELGVVQFQ